ncbi:MAG: hypothetical protein HZA17_02075 [Nitrospirae bacterium]|nr:hypothetical protein [Nitrospirota bacterium]
MAKRFVFFYLMKHDPEGIRAVVPEHVAYWHNLILADYLGGPFSDKSGGLITFSADDADEATSIVSADPFITHDLIEQKWIKEWTV